MLTKLSEGPVAALDRKHPSEGLLIRLKQVAGPDQLADPLVHSASYLLTSLQMDVIAALESPAIL